MTEQELRSNFFAKTGRIATSDTGEYQVFLWGFQAGVASRDAEVVSLTNQRDYEYVRAENAEHERGHLSEQLAEREKQVVLLWDALAMWNVASENSEESELDDMACYCVPMPLFCDADEAMGDALAKVRKP